MLAHSIADDAVEKYDRSYTVGHKGQTGGEGKTGNVDSDNIQASTTLLSLTLGQRATFYKVVCFNIDFFQNTNLLQMSPDVKYSSFELKRQENKPTQQLTS